jgi:hypothetical protein
MMNFSLIGEYLAAAKAFEGLLMDSFLLASCYYYALSVYQAEFFYVVLFNVHMYHPEY